MKYCTIVLLGLAILLPNYSGLIAAEVKLQPDTVSKRKSIKYRFLPSAYYLPETRIAAGGVFFAIIASPDSPRKTGNLQHYISFTQNRQILFENSWQIFGAGNAWLWQGNADFNRFPELFFGIGRSDSICLPVLYRANQVNFQQQLLKKVGKHLFVGISTSLNHLSRPEVINHAMPEKLLQANGGMGFWAGRYGPALVYDSRDFALNTKQGTYLEISAVQGFFQSGKPFYFISNDYRKFIPIKKLSSVLAIQAVHRISKGEIPFRLMPSLGGASLMRGYYFGQLRNNMIWMVQTEWRQHIAGRFGLVGFGGIGNFAAGYSSLFDELHSQIGLGLRCKVNKNERVNMRLVYAHTGKYSNFYVVLAEAF